jgi:predicted peptidase
MVAGVGQSRQETHTLDRRVCRNVRLKYLLFLPEGCGREPEHRWPLILFLHGMGERGDDLEDVKKHGIPKIVEQRADFPFIVVSPQCPADSWWTAELEALEALLDEVAERLAVDLGRVYLTGLSMGGFGTWRLAARSPDRFAAIAPICGGWQDWWCFPDRLRVLKDMPIWAFHGDKDDAVPVGESERMVEALRKLGADVRLTVYPDCGHDSWTRTYEDQELYEWFLSHRRGE